jgi:NAD-dependent deacetylase
MLDEILIQRLKKARRVAVLTGAGVSAESGVPTFRGEDGIWNKLRPEELASMDAFMSNPERVWEWYNYRKQLISRVEPNPGHYVIVEMEKYYPEFWLITQNVDNLHRRAGNRNILELHGNIMMSRCMRCSKYFDTIDIGEKKDIPRCSCGSMIRPDVVWFGEMLPEETLKEAFHAASICDLFFSIGTSALVQPSASLPVLAREAGAYVVEINTDETVISSRVNIFLSGKSGEILPALWANVV